jgi:hypothetical protein
MTESQTQSSAALSEAARELQSAGHDAQVAFDCIALGELDRAHTHALTARVALDAAVTALAATLDDAGHEDAGHEDAGHEDAGHEDAGHEDNASI